MNYAKKKIIELAINKLNEAKDTLNDKCYMTTLKALQNKNISPKWRVTFAINTLTALYGY